MTTANTQTTTAATTATAAKAVPPPVQAKADKPAVTKPAAATTAVTKPAAKPAAAAKPATAKPVTANHVESAESKFKPIGFMIPVSLIREGDNKSRYYKEDKESLETFGKEMSKLGGMINPITVAPRGKDGKYELLAGYRRFLAYKAAGEKEIPATLWAGETDAVNFTENFKRKNLSRVEVALYIKDLAHKRKWKLPHLHGKPKPGSTEYNVKEAAKELGVSSAFVTQSCRLLVLDDKLLDKLHNEEMDAEAALKFENMPASVREEVLAIAEEIAEADRAAKAKARGSDKATQRTGKDIPEASRQTVVAANQAKKKAAKVTGRHVAKASAKAAGARGRTAEEKAALEGIASGKSYAGSIRTIADMDAVIGMLKGEGGKCDDLVGMYEDWRAGKIEDDGLAQWLQGAMMLAAEGAV